MRSVSFDSSLERRSPKRKVVCRIRKERSDQRRSAAPVPESAPRAARFEALTRRATLNAVAALLDYAVKAIVVLLVTPVLVSGLGRALYGVWEMLARLGTSMTAVDGRPTDALRLIIAQQQSTNDDEAR